MGQVSAFLRYVSGPITAGYAHWCPACEEMHVIQTSSPEGRPKWGFDGKIECPTFTPSVRISLPEHIDDEGTIHPSRVLCHYFITAGQINFCSDSDHALKGQTVPLPPIPANMAKWNEE